MAGWPLKLLLVSKDRIYHHTIHPVNRSGCLRISRVMWGSSVPALLSELHRLQTLGSFVYMRAAELERRKP